MKLLRVENDRYIFTLTTEEMNLLALTLRLYPVIPAAHQKLSKTLKHDQGNQRLLDEALAAQREENKKHVEELLTDAGRFKESEESIEMALSTGDIEWLLQVLNDVHVGNWILMGQPEKRPRFSAHSKNAPFMMGLDLAEMFQSALLDAMNSSSQ